MAGISNAGVSQIDVAREVLGGRLVSMQDQFWPSFRSSRGELEQCTNLGLNLGLSFLPWSPLGGIANVEDLAASRSRSASIRDSAAGSHLEHTADQFALSSV